MRSRDRAFRCTACLLAAWFSLEATAQTQMFGVALEVGQGRQTFGEFDPFAGTFTPLRQLGPRRVADLAYNSNAGVMYALEATTDSLIRINTGNGIPTSIGSYGGGVVDLQGLAYDPTGDVLYGAKNNQLYSLDQATGAATLLFTHEEDRFINGMAFEPTSGLLYFSNDSRTYAIDPVTMTSKRIGFLNLPGQPLLEGAGDGLVLDPSLGGFFADEFSNGTFVDLYRVGTYTGGVEYVSQVNGLKAISALEVVPSTTTQSSTNWSAAVSGSWNDAANWSTTAAPDNGLPQLNTTYNVAIATGAVAAPYTITLDQSVFVDSLVIDDPNVTLVQNSGAAIDVGTNGLVQLLNGTWIADFASIGAQTIEIAPQASLIARGLSVFDAQIRGKIVADAQVTDHRNFTSISLQRGATLDNATIELVSGKLVIAGDPAPGMKPGSALLGTGEVVFNGVQVDDVGRGPRGIWGNGHTTIGPGITLRTGTAGVYLETNFGDLELQGSLIADTENANVLIDPDSRFSFINTGQIVVSNGANVRINRMGSDAGNITLTDDGGSLEIFFLEPEAGEPNWSWDIPIAFSGTNGETRLSLNGAFDVSGAITVSDGAVLELDGDWTNSALITVDNASLSINGQMFDASLVQAQQSDVEVRRMNSGGGAISTAKLNQINAGGNTLVINGVLNNAGGVVDLGQWSGDVTLGRPQFFDAWIVEGSIVSDATSELVVDDLGYLAGVDVDAPIRVKPDSDLYLRTSSAGPVPVTRQSITLEVFSEMITEDWVNHGTVVGSTAGLEINGNFVNNGSITMNGGFLVINTDYLSLGDVTINNTFLGIGGAITTAQLNAIQGDAAQIVLAEYADGRNFGQIDNTGQTLDLDILGPIIFNDGRIDGGTITGNAAAGNLLLAPGWVILEDVTLATDLFAVRASGNSGQMNITDVALDGATITLGNQRKLLIGGSLSGQGAIVIESSPQDQILEVGGFVSGPDVSVLVRNGDLDVRSGHWRNEGAIAVSNSHSLTFENAGFENIGSLDISGGSRVVIEDDIGAGAWQNDGQVSLDDGSLIFQGNSLTNNANGRIAGHGEIILTPTSMTNHGTIAPDAVAQPLLINRDQANASADLINTTTAVIEIRVEGSTSDQYSVLEVDGEFWAAGTLQIVNDAAYTPAFGDTLSVIQSDGVQGWFDQVLGTQIAPGLFWSTQVNDGDIWLVAVPEAGDMNGDGAVTNADISAFVMALTDPGQYVQTFPELDADLAGDFTDDNLLTNADIAGFVDRLTGGGSGLATSAEVAELKRLVSVPEPSSLLLLGIGGLLIARRRRG